MDELPEYPEPFEEALDEVAKQKQIKVLRYEYWGVPIRTLQWVDNRVLRRVQFDFRDNDIGVTLKTEKTGGIFSFYKWCHNNIPMFPYLLKITYLEKQPLSHDCSVEEYMQAMKSLVESDV